VDHVHDLRTVTEADQPRLGAKAVNLGRMMTTSLPVPLGFCIEDDVPADAAAIVDAYQALGGGWVAVPSSAAGEDEVGSAAAGVYRSRLGVRGVKDLIAAIEDVRRSARAEYVRAYQPGGPVPRLAVIVQRFVDADVSGVVFTRDPGDAAGNTLGVAAAWGLGTSVVGGAAADRFQVDRIGQVLGQTIAAKRTRHTIAGVEPVTAEKVDTPCLTPGQLQDLTALAVVVEGLFGEPCDIEWAFADGQFWLLQARPVTASNVLDLERLREREIRNLRPLVGPHGTVWRRYDIAESAPRPTPMTWGVLQTMLSVHGGYGRMLRALGFTPDPRVDDTGFVQLIAGQPYLNLNLEARLDHHDIPYAVNVERLKRTPALALAPQRELMFARTPARFWLRLPAILWRSWRQTRHLRRLRATYAHDLVSHAMAFNAEVLTHRRVNLANLANDVIVSRFEEWRQRTLADFAASALQPAVFANLALHDVLRGAEGAERARRMDLLRDVLVSAGRPSGYDLAAALAALVRGSSGLRSFLANFGHRGPEELELAQPRWSEVPPTFEQFSNPGRPAGTSPHGAQVKPGAISDGTVRTDPSAPIFLHAIEETPTMVMARTGRHTLNQDYSEPYDYYSPHPFVGMFLFADGSVRPLYDTTSVDVWVAIGTRAGGEVIPRGDF
jgi:prepilin-type processing-associated H-X9-DG protein